MESLIRPAVCNSTSTLLWSADFAKPCLRIRAFSAERQHFDVQTRQLLAGIASSFRLPTGPQRGHSTCDSERCAATIAGIVLVFVFADLLPSGSRAFMDARRASA
jgi:hypothetical protein